MLSCAEPIAMTPVDVELRRANCNAHCDDSAILAKLAEQTSSRCIRQYPAACTLVVKVACSKAVTNDTSSQLPTAFANTIVSDSYIQQLCMSNKEMRTLSCRPCTIQCWKLCCLTFGSLVSKKSNKALDVLHTPDADMLHRSPDAHGFPKPSFNATWCRYNTWFDRTCCSCSDIYVYI